MRPAAVRPRPAKTLYCYSPNVVPTPHDWPPDTVATGYWLSEDDDGPIDPELEAFVAAGEEPVYVGFGSSVGPDPIRLSRAVDQALRVTGARAVIATGWGGLAGPAWNDDTIVVEQASHRWLFPRVAAVVHHGGAGTTAAGLRAGRPSIVCPFQGDQYFWGKAVRQVGAGPQPVPAKKLTAERLSVAIRTALEDRAMRGRATELRSASLARLEPSELRRRSRRRFPASAWTIRGSPRVSGGECCSRVKAGAAAISGRIPTDLANPEAVVARNGSGPATSHEWPARAGHSSVRPDRLGVANRTPATSLSTTSEPSFGRAFCFSKALAREPRHLPRQLPLLSRGERFVDVGVKSRHVL